MPDAVCPKDGAHTVSVAASSRQTYPLGTLIADRYRIDDVIGIGGFGAVYRCTQLNMDQTVAVKVLRADHLSSVEHVKRFSGEAQAVSRLRHPNTIRVFDFGTHEDGALYLAMEFIEGETLGHRFDTQGALPWTQLVRILTQVCHSLTEAHAAGLVHRDLKPENVMLLPVAGDPDFVKVLDFGIAKQQKTDDHAGNLTETGMIMGTPTYMSPEQAKGEPIDGRSDVYALGILAYEALVGRPPFLGDSPMTVLVKHIKDPPPPFIREGALREVPRELEELVLACLAKDPRQRPQSTSELAEKLIHIAETARRPTPTVAMAAQSDDRATRVVPLAERPLDATTALPPALSPPPSRKPLWIAGGAFVLVLAGTAAVALVGPTGDRPVAIAEPKVTVGPPPPVQAPRSALAAQPDPVPAHAPEPVVARPAPAVALPGPLVKKDPEAPRIEPVAKPEPEARRREPEPRRAEARSEAPKAEPKIESKAEPKAAPVRDPTARERSSDRPPDHNHNHEAFRLDDDRPDPPKK